MPFLILFGLMAVIFWVMQRRASGQVNGIMSIGRSRAKTYSSERPGTTFADVAGYEGVKQEIREVVDFLKFPDRFGQIGARIPKGVLLVGPPGTGKTLIARAVAGEAGVPFLSVTGSDFMEMFVGVGASRVRDLFQTARKMGRAIIFVDEIDSIGRKRGAGLGGGHDEREQTLNQMLSEMDGFEATEGIVMIAATNRPDILDPALLRPGRFDRQVVVPLPELSERLAVLNVHAKGKSVSSDVDMSVVARGTPGMSGADLANLVNEAALHAVREDRNLVTMSDFDYARDRMLMGQRRESLAMSEREKELTAYHEGGHAVCAAVLPNADPIHKVTILPMGMALGVTMQLPEEDRHSYEKDWIEERIVVAMGGRIAEQLVFGVMSSGASNDLVTSTEFARRMVREFGMSDRIGPMAWGSQQQVFLGDDLMHTREYSDETARGHRRRGRAHPPLLRGPLPGHPHRVPLQPRPRGPRPARARDHRRRRGRPPRRARVAPAAARVAAAGCPRVVPAPVVATRARRCPARPVSPARPTPAPPSPARCPSPSPRVASSRPRSPSRPTPARPSRPPPMTTGPRCGPAATAPLPRRPPEPGRLSPAQDVGGHASPGSGVAAPSSRASSSRSPARADHSSAAVGCAEERGAGPRPRRRRRPPSAPRRCRSGRAAPGGPGRRRRRSRPRGCRAVGPAPRCRHRCRTSSDENTTTSQGASGTGEVGAVQLRGDGPRGALRRSARVGAALQDQCHGHGDDDEGRGDEERRHAVSLARGAEATTTSRLPRPTRPAASRARRCLPFMAPVVSCP